VGAGADTRQYSWTRDSALTMLTISSRFLPSMYLKPWLYNQSNPVSKGGFDVPSDNAKDALIEPLIRDYVHFQQHLQMVTTRSGDLWTGGLNEPKFHVDGTAFDGEWGRPQMCVAIKSL
jgi:glucoamylase